jgi:hypothetical protein
MSIVYTRKEKKKEKPFPISSKNLELGGGEKREREPFLGSFSPLV